MYYGADSGWWKGLPRSASTYDGFRSDEAGDRGVSSAVVQTFTWGPKRRCGRLRRWAGCSGLLMPIHWGLFNLALHAWRAPMAELDGTGEGDGGAAVVAGTGAADRRYGRESELAEFVVAGSGRAKNAG